MTIDLKFMVADNPAFEGNETYAVRSLSIPPGNRLELLRGNRKGQHSIRINNQWRICFIWRVEGVYEVEIVDYH